MHSLRSIMSWDVDVLEIRLFFGVFFSFHFHSFEMKMHKLNKNNNTHIIIIAQARTNACRFICFLLFSNDLLSSSCITWNALLSSFDSEYRRICALIQKICLFARFFLFNCISIVFFLTHSLQRFSIVKWTSNKILWLEHCNSGLSMPYTLCICGRWLHPLSIVTMLYVYLMKSSKNVTCVRIYSQWGKPIRWKKKLILLF